MKMHRSVLFTVSCALMAMLVGGGFALRARASDDSFRQAVLFSEVLSLVLDNYVDPVEAERLLRGAYEGMLGGLDPNGAFLSADEVKVWKGYAGRSAANPGLSVLKLGRGLQVVGVDPGSPAAEAGMEVGDQIRSIDGEAVRDLSLAQARQALGGAAGTEAALEVLKVSDDFRAEEVKLMRQPRRPLSYVVNLQRGIAVLKVRNLAEVDLEAIRTELDDLKSRNAEHLLVDLRNAVEGGPREAARFAGWLSGGTLRLRDTNGRVVETLEPDGGPLAWPGKISILVNWATAGGAEAVTLLAREARSATVFGQSTYGLGAEAKLYELESGSGLLLSSAQWETADGSSWNAVGIEPDEVVEGRGDTFSEVESDQLSRVLDLIEGKPGDEAVPEAA